MQDLTLSVSEKSMISSVEKALQKAIILKVRYMACSRQWKSVKKSFMDFVL